MRLRFRPRSGLALKNGITVLNSPGTIDADYRGEVGVVLINHSKDVFYINNGDRIAQLVFAKHEQATLVRVSVLDKAKGRKEGLVAQEKNKNEVYYFCNINFFTPSSCRTE